MAPNRSGVSSLSHFSLPILLNLLFIITVVSAQCPVYTSYASQRHGPFTEGRWNLSYQRPIESCRTFRSEALEGEIKRLRGVVVDNDLFRLFENCWPSTLDTTVAWKGFGNGTKSGGGKKLGTGELEELSFIITGDIEAMWLRDSANQLQSYVSLLKPDGGKDNNSIASLFRGAINLQARYILGDPYCNAFQSPDESGIPHRSSANSDTITPSYDYMHVFSCNWELDSVASFLQLSYDYYDKTGDWEFFAKFDWVKAVKKVLEITTAMTMDSYAADGTWQHTPYTYCAPYGGSPINNCNGSPHRGNIGLVRSYQRPSDDSCIYQYLIPSNMMYSVALNRSSTIMSKIEQHLNPNTNNAATLTTQMRTMSTSIRHGIETHAIVTDPVHGRIYAYEIDGYGSAILMDDPNIPSLLSAPFLGYLPRTDPVYLNTRRKILSRDNPYYAWGPVLSGPGSPHTLPGKPWPMANLVAILTSDDDDEIIRHLGWVVGSTGGLGVVHESVSAQDAGVWSRSWFSWANGLVGQVVLDLEGRKPYLLKRAYQ
ncbi:hypothetical protein CC80DRAFT_397003 [Byssothecium circinans]|uniref:Glycoside hydrolase family 125 protein n=1 Tax=Byssothecium circinans TaxID=147558 RepID=A0A6A5UHC4_9PLEO|nr:hypothetical protein CC80DRAFT_397003 [Byssothecium circinans]